MNHSHNNRKWLKQPQGHFHGAIRHNATLFPLFLCIFCMATPGVSSSSKNINNAAYPDYLAFLMTMNTVVTRMKKKSLNQIAVSTNNLV